MSAIPTMASPNIASPHPTTCLLLIFKSINQYENISVVTILPPLSNMKLDPEIKASALHCIMLEIKSESPGMMKIFGE